MTSAHSPGGTSAAGAHRSLRLTQAALLLIGLGLGVVGTRNSTWPIQTWPMYVASTPEFPPPRAFAVELRVTDRDGGLQTLAPRDLFSFERGAVAAALIEHAFDDSDPRRRDADRAFLVALLNRRRAGPPIATLEGWRLEWEVDPLALPPLNRPGPMQAVLLGSFSAALPASGR